MLFFPETEDEKIFVYLLEVMPTFDKIQKTSPSMCTEFEIRGQSILKVIQVFHIVSHNSVHRVVWPSSQESK